VLEEKREKFRELSQKTGEIFSKLGLTPNQYTLISLFFVLISFYFLYRSWQAGFSLAAVLMATILMIIVCKFLARPVPGRGIALPAFIPPLFAVLFAFLLAPEFAAPTAFISGVLGTLIGADILNLRRIQKISPGYLSIGGAGVFDGIFLVGIISALLAGF